jgi:predicted ATPase/DNA-binding NarL/FixJ family response regulator
LSSTISRRVPPLVGRDELCRRVAAALETTRLLTLTGPGGMGKTSLARAVLADVSARDRWFVDLSPLQHQRETPDAVAAALGLVVTEAEDAESAVLAYLQPRAALLVLDNLELLTGMGQQIQRWLDGSPGLTILATSRLPIGAPGEVELPVPGLDLPVGDSPAEVEASAAGALYLRVARALGALQTVERATARDLASLLARLDGMPLAIELAAGRSRILTPSGVLQRLDDPTVVASGPAQDHGGRHESLDRVLTMTLDLLPPGERRLLAALSACPGTFDVESAQALAPDVPAVPALDALVSAGLVRSSGGSAGEPRFRLLETIRARVLRDVTAADRATALERHARVTAAIVERLERTLASDEPGAILQMTALDENVAGAVDWAADNDVALGMRLLVAHDRLAVAGAHGERSVRWYQVMLARAPLDDPRRPFVLGSLVHLLTRYSGPREALALEGALLAATADAPRPVQRAAYLRLGLAYYAIGDQTTTARMNELAADAADDPDDAEALRLDGAAIRAWAVDGSLEQASELQARSAEASARAGRVTNQGIATFHRALIELHAGRTDVAIRLARQAVGLCPPGYLRAFAGSILVLALAEGGETGPGRDALAAAWREVEREARIDRLEVLDAAVALLAAEGRHAAALSALGIADRERPATGWARDQHVEHALDRWRRRSARAIGPVAVSLAEAASETIEGAVAGALVAPHSGPATRGPRRLDDLTRREVEVLALVGRGRTDGEIAATLFISPKTASVHVANLKGKLGLGTRLQVALQARAMGLAPDGSEPVIS